MKRIKYLFINIGKLIAFPFILVWEVAAILWDLLTESPEEAEEREHRMLHDENMFGEVTNVTRCSNYSGTCCRNGTVSHRKYRGVSVHVHDYSSVKTSIRFYDLVAVV